MPAIGRVDSAELGGVGPADLAARRHHPGQHVQGHPEQVRHLLAPATAADVEEQGSRRVGGIGGVDPAAGQPEDQPAVDRAGGGLASALDVVDRPAQLGGREVGVDDEAGHAADPLPLPRLPKPVALGGRTAVLPDDRRVEGTAVAPVPEHERLPLVRYPHRAHVRRCRAGRLQCVAGRVEHRPPDLLRVVLDPARTGIVLGDLPVALAVRLAVLADRHHRGPGRALVEGEHDSLSHRGGAQRGRAPPGPERGGPAPHR